MKIEIYTTQVCPYCISAKRWLTQRGYTYTEIPLDDPDTREKFKQENPSMRTVPQIFADGKHIGGYSELIVSDLA